MPPTTAVPVAGSANPHATGATSGSAAHVHHSANAASHSATAPTGAKVGSMKKAKGRKAADPSETEKLLAAKINQLELDAAGEKDQEQEIEREVRKATRDLNNLLAGMGTPLERMEALQKRIADLMADMKRVEREHVKGKKRADALQKERDAQRAELNKSNSVKEKLEKLAREFTKENKKLKEDLRRMEENEGRMREAGFARDAGLMAEHDAFMEINRKQEPSKSLAEVDELFRQKFKSFFDQYNLREMHFLSVLRAKDSEIQHYLARLENQKKVVDNETTRARQLTTQVSTFSQTESELRSQLNIYVEKFKQVEDTLNNSNDLFLTFRKEMEEMSKKTKRLEKENLTLTRKHDLTNRNILEMAEERATMQRELDASRKKVGTLESIIRHMQEQGRDPGPAAAAAAVDEDAEGTESEYDDSAEEEDDADAARSRPITGDGAADEPVPKSRTYRYPPQPSASPPPAAATSVPTAKRSRGGAAGRTVNGIVNGNANRGSQRVEV